jgi:hypothetical protein
MSENNSVLNQSDDGYELEGNWFEMAQSLALDQYLQCHVEEFCDTLAAADAYIQELTAENVQLKAQFAESDIQALQNRCSICSFQLCFIASEFLDAIVTDTWWGTL